MDHIIRALVEAGYFRARISSLSDFDKTIGGMAWAMQVFSRDIDINIFYKDTLDLGQKIALTERLVMVLLIMNCPHKIEPHQIVGLDHANLLPVIRWLIKRSAEIRREHEAFNRLLALRHYHRITNTQPDRDLWCHVLDDLQMTELKVAEAASIDDTSIGAEGTSRGLINRLRKDFKDNELISFVKSQPFFVINQLENRHEDDLKLEEPDESDEEEEEEEEPESGGEDREVINEYRSIDETTSMQHDDQPRDDTAELEQETDDLLKEHKELDIELLATNQKVLSLLKRLDLMPSDLEIIQYQRRYVELHQQLISKNKDFKKLYALFNCLDSEKHYLTKEINLLDSIMSNLDRANSSPSYRYDFLKQFQDIIGKIQLVRDEVVSKLNILREKCDNLKEEYVKLSAICDDQ